MDWSGQDRHFPAVFKSPASRRPLAIPLTHRTNDPGTARAIAVLGPSHPASHLLHGLGRIRGIRLDRLGFVRTGQTNFAAFTRQRSRVRVPHRPPVKPQVKRYFGFAQLLWGSLNPAKTPREFSHSRTLLGTWGADPPGNPHGGWSLAGRDLRGADKHPTSRSWKKLEAVGVCWSHY